ncbi:hypothetical protein C8J57DRAFT_1505911 [Mycena rebaudengoi]|nr:hypothetical protein C8J57DRAFT_1505911 [Mycena rebaudengoi]
MSNARVATILAKNVQTNCEATVRSPHIRGPVSSASDGRAPAPAVEVGTHDLSEIPPVVIPAPPSTLPFSFRPASGTPRLTTCYPHVQGRWPVSVDAICVASGIHYSRHAPREYIILPAYEPVGRPLSRRPLRAQHPRATTGDSQPVASGDTSDIASTSGSATGSSSDSAASKRDKGKGREVATNIGKESASGKKRKKKNSSNNKENVGHVHAAFGSQAVATAPGRSSFCSPACDQGRGAVLHRATTVPWFYAGKLFACYENTLLDPSTLHPIAGLLFRCVISLPPRHGGTRPSIAASLFRISRATSSSPVCVLPSLPPHSFVSPVRPPSSPAPVLRLLPPSSFVSPALPPSSPVCVLWSLPPHSFVSSAAPPPPRYACFGRYLNVLLPLPRCRLPLQDPAPDQSLPAHGPYPPHIVSIEILASHSSADSCMTPWSILLSVSRVTFLLCVQASAQEHSLPAHGTYPPHLVSITTRDSLPPLYQHTTHYTVSLASPQVALDPHLNLRFRSRALVLRLLCFSRRMPQDVGYKSKLPATAEDSEDHEPRLEFQRSPTLAICPRPPVATCPVSNRNVPQNFPSAKC